MRGAELIVAILERYGVNRVFGLPGDATPFFRALHKSSIHFVTMRDERHAGFAAGMYGHILGKPGVAYISRGPGGTNLLSGVACSFLEGYPLLYIIDQQSRRDCVDRRVHMFVDFEAVYEPVSKGVSLIWNANDIPRELARAWSGIQTPPKGPWGLVVPLDVLNEDAEPTFSDPLPQRAEKEESLEAAEALRRHLAESKQPVLILGPDVREYARSGILRSFVDHLALPFFTTRHAKGIISETHPLNYGIMRKDNLSLLSSEFDLVITIGHGVPDKNYLWTNSGHKITHVNIADAPCIRTWWFNPSEEYLVDWERFFALVSEKIPQNDDPKSFSLTSRVWQERERQKIKEVSGEHLLWHLLAPEHLGSILTAEDILIPDTGLNKIYVLSAYQSPGPNIVCASAFSAIGFAVPASIGASLARPEARVVVVCGDGGFLMSAAELETISRLKLPVKIIVSADGAYGYIKERQHEAFGGAVGVDFTNPDFEHFARAFGFNYLPVYSKADLAKVVQLFRNRKDEPALIVLHQKYRHS
ncbi:MAG: thiamine pyrophosphate-binding protein [Parcubacteria group bacterium]|nr:thiamine pyrophosphate-binding protein [Parcubacteria group bacterium]